MSQLPSLANRSNLHILRQNVSPQCAPKPLPMNCKLTPAAAGQFEWEDSTACGHKVDLLLLIGRETPFCAAEWHDHQHASGLTCKPTLEVSVPCVLKENDNKAQHCAEHASQVERRDTNGAAFVLTLETRLLLRNHNNQRLS